MRRIISILIVSLLPAAAGRAFDFQAPAIPACLPLSYLATFTSNARAAGVGNAYTGAFGEAGCQYWNPAGISWIRYHELGLTSIPLFAGSQYSALEFAYPLNPETSVGIGVVRLNSGEIERTNSLGQNEGYSFSESQTAYQVSCGRIINDGMAAGISIKAFSQVIDAYSQQSCNMDAGLLFRGHNTADFGIAVQNLIPGSFGPDKVSPDLKAGIRSSSLNNRLLLYLDGYALDIFGTARLRWGAGLEYTVGRSISLRCGANQRELCLGFGLQTKTAGFDYAASVNQVDITHKFSMTARFGLPLTEEVKTAREEYSQLLEKNKALHQDIEIEEFSIREKRQELKTDSWAAAQLFLAKDAMEAKNYEKAESVLRQILLKKPECAEAQTLLSELLRKTDNESAGRLYMEAYDRYLKKDYAAALENADRALAVDPGMKSAQELKFLAQAQRYAQERKYNDAKGELFDLLKMDPQHQEATMLLKRLQTIIEVSGNPQSGGVHE